MNDLVAPPRRNTGSRPVPADFCLAPRLVAVLEVKDLPPAERDPLYYIQRARAKHTNATYYSCLRQFAWWARLPNPFPTTATVIAYYLSELAATHAPSTVATHAYAIRFAQLKLGFGDPFANNAELRDLLAGIKKTKAQEDGWTVDQAPAFTRDDFVRMIRAIGNSLVEHRDRAYLLLALYGAFRQSELSRLTVDQLVPVTAKGLAIPMGTGKTDPTGEKRFVKAIPYGPDGLCAVTAVQTWLAASAIEDGPVFQRVRKNGTVGETATEKEKRLARGDARLHPPGLSHTAANNLVRHYVKKAGLEDKGYSGHSLRASYVTLMRQLGASDDLITRQTFHTDTAMLKVYDRPADAFAGNPVGQLGEALGRSVTLT